MDFAGRKYLPGPTSVFRFHRGHAARHRAVLVLGMADDDGVPLRRWFGMFGLLVNHFFIPKARAYRLRSHAAECSNVAAALKAKRRLRGYAIAGDHLRSEEGGPLILPELVLETKSGSKQRFGVRPVEFQGGLRVLETDVSRALAWLRAPTVQRSEANRIQQAAFCRPMQRLL